MFKEEKTIQIAAQFLKHTDGRMPYIKLLKLMYYADREMLQRWGVPMTYDRWYSMKCGPILSATYDLIKSNAESIWSVYIRTEEYDIVLRSDPRNDELSRAESEIIEETFNDHGDKDKWTLVCDTHNLPEWVDPGERTVEITYRTVLEVEGVPLPEIDKIIGNIETENAVDCFLAKAG